MVLNCIVLCCILSISIERVKRVYSLALLQVRSGVFQCKDRGMLHLQQEECRPPHTVR